MTQPPPPTIRDLPSMVARGADVYRRSPRSGTIMAVIVLGVYAVGRTAATLSLAADEVLWAIVIDLVSPVVATTLALPWFHVALAAEHNEDIPLEQNWHRSSGSFRAMAVAAIPLWLAIFLGLVFSFGIFSVVAVIGFGLTGFVLADERLSARRALRNSLRLGRNRWGIVSAVAIVLLVLNGIAALPLITGQLFVMLVAVPLLIASTNISMGVGARLYDGLKTSMTLPGGAEPDSG